jgi:hypothetical protein
LTGSAPFEITRDMDNSDKIKFFSDLTKAIKVTESLAEKLKADFWEVHFSAPDPWSNDPVVYTINQIIRELETWENEAKDHAKNKVGQIRRARNMWAELVDLTK